MSKLTSQQQAFVAEYLIDLNYTQAAIRAGYKPSSAGHTGQRLAKKSHIAAAIARAMADRSRRTGITADRVLRELGCMGFCNPRDVIDLETGAVRSDASDDDVRAISSIRVRRVPVRATPDDDTADGDSVGADQIVTAVDTEVRFADKLKALDMIARHIGLYNASGIGDITANVGVVLLPAVADLPVPPDDNNDDGGGGDNNAQ